MRGTGLANAAAPAESTQATLLLAGHDTGRLLDPIGRQALRLCLAGVRLQM